MTKGELIIIAIAIVGSLSLGLLTTIRLAKRIKTKGLRLVSIAVLVLATLMITIFLIPASLYLRDKLLFKGVKTECGETTGIFVGQYWRAGQSYALEIENGDFKMSDEFIFDKPVSEEKPIGEYCCQLDSCSVRFTLDNKDTVFYIHPGTIKRLYVGSSIDKDFVVLTNENFGIRM